MRRSKVLVDKKIVVSLSYSELQELKLLQQMTNTFEQKEKYNNYLDKLINGRNGKNLNIDLIVDHL